MIPDNLPTWKCPLCNKVRMKFGTTCLMFFDETCEHMHELNINGLIYQKINHTKITESASIGIAAISDE